MAVRADEARTAVFAARADEARGAVFAARADEARTAVFAGRDYRVAVESGPVAPELGGRVVRVLRGLGRLWFRGWVLHAAELRRAQEWER